MEELPSTPVIEESVNLAAEAEGSNSSKSQVFWEKISKIFSLQDSKIKKFYFKTVIAMSNIVFSLALILMLPNYVQKSNQSGGSTYTSLFVTALVSSLTLLGLCLLKKTWDSSFKFRSGLPLKKLAKYAAFQSLGALLIFQSQDRYRIPCHFQDSMFLICLPVAFIVSFMKSKTGYLCWTRRLVIGFGIFMAALFLGTSLQLADRFHCRGVDWQDPLEGFGKWNWESNILWTILRAVGLGLYITGLTLTLDFCAGEHGKHRCLETLTWISVFSFCIIALCCWIDTFVSIGKGATWWDFSSAFAQGFQCHFSTVQDCVGVSLTFAVFIVSMLLFLLSSIIMAKSFKYTPVLIISCSCLAVPLTSLWWSVFVLKHEGVHFQPQFGANCIAGLLAFPVACAAFTYCLKNYQNLKKAVECHEKSRNI